MLGWWPGNSGAQTLDRVVASIGNSAILQSDVEREYRFELFLDGKAPANAPSREARERARDRLIDQKLLAEEAESESTPSEEDSKAMSAEMAEVKSKFATPGAYESALRSLGLTEQQVAERILEDSRILRLIDRRLRPEAAVERADVETYYRETFLPEYSRRGNRTPPPLSEVEGRIREILVQKKIDELLAQWLKDLRGSHRVKIHSL